MIWQILMLRNGNFLLSVEMERDQDVADITNGVIESEKPIEIEPTSLSVEHSFEISVSSNQSKRVP